MEKKAAQLGLDGIWQRGLAYCDQTRAEDEVCRAAAVRAQQLCGCIPRVLDEPVEPEAHKPAKVAKPKSIPGKVG